jgi:hypothetical protein
VGGKLISSFGGVTLGVKKKFEDTFPKSVGKKGQFGNSELHFEECDFASVKMGTAQRSTRKRYKRSTHSHPIPIQLLFIDYSLTIHWLFIGYSLTIH